MSGTTRRAALGAALAIPCLGRASFGQEWPSRPIRLIVAFAAGGAADTVARAYGATLSEILGQSVIVENRTGGNAVIAANATLQSPADGYTFLVDAANQITNPLLMQDLAFDYRKAFTPVSLLASFPQVLAVKTGFPAQDVAAYIAQAKAQPGSISYGTPPTAGMGHMAGELLQQMAGIRLIHTPYRGGSEAARDIASGTLDSVIITTSSIRPPVETGRAKVLAVTSSHRAAAYPNAPTLAESGLRGFDMNDWNGVFAAAAMPQPIMDRLQGAIAQAAKSDSVLNRLSPLGAEVVGGTSQEFNHFLNRNRTVLAKVIKDGGISLN